MSPELLKEILSHAQPQPFLWQFLPRPSYDPAKDTTCTYCLGGKKVHGGGFMGFLTYLWWRMGGRLIPQRCPECKGTGQQQSTVGGGQ